MRKMFAAFILLGPLAACSSLGPLATAAGGAGVGGTALTVLNTAASVSATDCANSALQHALVRGALTAVGAGEAALDADDKAHAVFVAACGSLSPE